MEKRLEPKGKQAKQFIKYSKCLFLYKSTFCCYSCGKGSCTGIPTVHEIMNNFGPVQQSQFTYEQFYLFVGFNYVHSNMPI